MRIGFHIKNAGLDNLDLRRPDLGNPGCGGRVYINTLYGFLLANLNDPLIEPVYFSETPGVLPENIEQHALGGHDEAVASAPRYGVDLLVLDCSQNAENVGRAIDLAESNGTKLIFRLGLTPKSESLHRIASSNAVVAVVCVDQQCFDIMVDHPAITKSTVIVNPVPSTEIPLPLPVESRAPDVVYLGSLVPQKGFSLLARAWPKVAAACPAARLRVIGSGQLYSRDRKLGRWGVAAESFEAAEIRPFLSGPDGLPAESVEFLGPLGKEKYDVLRRATVGVANPSGRTERCSSASLEIQATGTPVVAGRRDGLWDTVRDGQSGRLIRGRRSLASNLITLLQNPSYAVSMGFAGRAYVLERYDPQRVAEQWQQLLHSIATQATPRDVRSGAACGSPAGRLAAMNARVRKFLPLRSHWPTYLGTRDTAVECHRWLRERVLR